MDCSLTCRGYANYTSNPSTYVTDNQAAFAFKCMRKDGKPKRVFEDCWDNSDCLSDMCAYPGYCYVSKMGGFCAYDKHCDKGLKCVYNPTFRTYPTC